MGAGYIGGPWLFINTVFGRYWHRVATGFPAVTTFASAMLLVTFLHWDKFDLSHLPFAFWLGLSVLTPFLIPFVWLRNRVTDSGTVAADDLTIPRPAQWSLLGLGVLLLIFAIIGFIWPGWTIEIWPWKLTPLTARVMSGWFSLMGVGGIVISRDQRWSAWKVGIESIGLWQILVLVAVCFNVDDFHDGPWNWYTASVFVVLMGMGMLYAAMMHCLRKKHGASDPNKTPT